MLLFMSLLLAFACEKDGDEHAMPADERRNQVIQNLRPQDVGPLHNRIMHRVIQAPSPAAAYDSVIDGLSRELALRPKEVQQALDDMGYTRAVFTQTRLGGLSAVKAPGYSAQVGFYLGLLDKELDQSILLGDYLGGLAKIKDLVDRDQKLSAPDRAALETILNVAEYSARHWTAIFPAQNKLKAGRRISPAAKRIIKADVGGAIGGAITGGLGGFAALGVGAVPGAILGGALGAAYGSALEGFWVSIGW